MLGHLAAGQMYFPPPFGIKWEQRLPEDFKIKSEELEEIRKRLEGLL